MVQGGPASLLDLSSPKTLPDGQNRTLEEVLVCLCAQILLREVPAEGKEKKRKKVLLATKIPSGDKSKSILDYVDETMRPVSGPQGSAGEAARRLQENRLLRTRRLTRCALQGSGWST